MYIWQTDFLNKANQRIYISIEKINNEYEIQAEVGTERASFLLNVEEFNKRFKSLDKAIQTAKQYIKKAKNREVILLFEDYESDFLDC